MECYKESLLNGAGGAISAVWDEQGKILRALEGQSGSSSRERRRFCILLSVVQSSCVCCVFLGSPCWSQEARLDEAIDVMN